MAIELITLDIPPQVEASIEARFEYFGRMRQLLWDMEKAKRDEPGYLSWRKSYFFPVLSAIDVAEGVGEVAARTGNFPGSKPPWFDVDPADWDGRKIKYPPGLSKGDRRTLAFRMGEKVSFTNVDEETEFGKELADTKRACHAETKWDAKIIWPEPG